ncbi:helix-turn-helix transcriptional regulator [Streptomyces daghestanicus]|uniref:Helix-turn-helix transcriptional regulator n=2 Tax=Streptomyces TaxID=1883 RepID=A0A918GUE2_STRGD|nr:helix-turn-helix transcriptional regulator [Streptomyces niveoruber]GGS78251.1 helix-turn-helix transcriptional regulator [Streptomyces griseoviridis]GGU15664.1 helix-turn-helix transcriptional regulator [Streptomyces daghestanicus]GHI35225.1 helix-turn-helix transcriptional regulator [Streptomyces daghestanicus]
MAALLDRLRTHGAGLVVTGEPGLGRTALLHRAAHAFTAGPVLHLRAGSDAAPAQPPGPVTPAWLPGPEDDRQHRAAPPCGSRVLAPGPGVSARTLLAAFRAAAPDGPLLVCADDAHLWDAAGRAALAEAAAAAAGAGRVGLLLSVAGHRPVDPEFAALPVVPLDPLTAPQAAALLDEVTDGTVDPAVRAELLAEAEGNPGLLLALVRRLTAAELRGHRPLPRPLADAGTLAGVAGRALTGLAPDARDLLLTVAVAAGVPGAPDAGTDVLLEAVRRLRSGAAAPRPELPGELEPAAGGPRFRSPLLRRAVHATADPARRRAAHRALAGVLRADGGRLPALLHRSWSAAAPPPGLGDRLAAHAGDGTEPASHRLRATAYVRAAELAADGPVRAERYTAAAEQELLAGRPDRARTLLAAARECAAPPLVRGRAELVGGLTELRDGPVEDAHQSLLLAASLLAADAPGQAAAAALAAADAAWAAGDLAACLATLGTGEGPRDAVGDHRSGMRALLEGRFDRAAGPLGHVLRRAGTEDRPESLLRSAAAALLLGEVDAARRAGARALAAARHLGSDALVPQALEYLAYAELRAGRHAQARAHAEEGLRTALRAGQRNTAALHHAVLALAASIEEAPEVVARHVTAAQTTARRHGLAQAATLAEWAAARADLGRGRPLDAADRLGLLVLPGPRRGHFAVWRLAVPCFVEAAVPAGRHEEARTVLADFADWAEFGADRQSAGQLARCRALLAAPEDADDLYRRALARHDETGGSDFERARTALLHGKWLRRRRRPKEARDRLGAALAGFERCGAGVWAEQTRGELRAIGGASRTGGAGALTRLTPQQLRIARHVAEGATNREVALTLAVSTRTVDYHLRKVFAALGVRSRVELARMIEQSERATAHP